MTFLSPTIRFSHDLENRSTAERITVGRTFIMSLSYTSLLLSSGLHHFTNQRPRSAVTRLHRTMRACTLPAMRGLDAVHRLCRTTRRASAGPTQIVAVVENDCVVSDAP